MKNRKLLIILASCLISLVGCKEKRESDVAIAIKHEPVNAVYHWKTVLNPNKYETDFMKRHHVRKMYVKFFDVGTDYIYDGKGEQPVPIATTVFKVDSTYWETNSIEVVPVVFITVEALRLKKPLGERIVKRVDDMCRANHIKYNEIQLDCDWTKDTKPLFYSLCQEVKKLMQNNRLDLSATIRLHQLRDTLPDIDYGVLMLYNTESLQDPKVKNSILSSSVVKEYMSHARSDKHLDFAYPTYEWTLWFKDNKFMGILTQGDTARHEGILRHENSDFTEIMEAKKSIKQYLKDIDYPSSTIIYHLDSANLSKYSNDEIEKIYSR